MADPIAGWQVLTDCLKKNGLMKIGLYSELARKGVTELRRQISERHVRVTKEDMLKFRNSIIKQSGALTNSSINWSDFYSFSELRDLLFHVQEHCFNIPTIKKISDDLNLTFLGFEFISNSASTAFKSKYPQKDAVSDLMKWHDHEILNPHLFAGMYQFWAQKV